MNIVRELLNALLWLTILGTAAPAAYAQEPALLTVSAPGKSMEEATRDLI